jgi:hypothetical protein
MKMNKEKMIALSKYIESLKDRLTAVVPEKHKGHVKTYHDFLKNEIKMTSDKLEKERLEGGSK